MGPILTSLGMRMLIGLGGNVKLMNQLILEGSNERTLELDPALWDDMRVPVNSVKIPGSNNPGDASFKGGLILAFSDQAVLGNEEYVYFTAQLPHTYKEGEDIESHVHWVGEDATIGDVYWRLTYSWANIGDAFPAESTIYVADTNSAIADTHNKVYFESISGTGKKISSMLVCSLSRHSSNILDTFGGKDAYLLEIDFHFPVNTLGSRQEVVK